MHFCPFTLYPAARKPGARALHVTVFVGAASSRDIGPGQHAARPEVDAITKFYGFILRIVPKLEEFPRNREFLIGDRIEPIPVSAKRVLSGSLIPN